MPNTYSALKRIRQTVRRTKFNRARKSRLRHEIRGFRRLLEQNDASIAQSALPGTFSMIDRAAKLGIIKKNTAARYKSRLTLRMKSLTGA
jgi:small subunit ribosomal protein S20